MSDKETRAEQDHGPEISDGALSLARLVDRLPTGDYMIDVQKRADRDGGMTADISKKERVRRVGNHGSSNGS